MGEPRAIVEEGAAVWRLPSSARTPMLPHERNGMPLSPPTIQLFGPLRVLLHGAPLPPVRTRSVEWLLVLLILRHGRAVERSWLAGTLWPESEELQALANLR